MGRGAGKPLPRSSITSLTGSRDGGARRDRTADLYNAIVALSQLSYGPTPGRRLSHVRMGVNPQPNPDSVPVSRVRNRVVGCSRSRCGAGGNAGGSPGPRPCSRRRYA